MAPKKFKPVLERFRFDAGREGGTAAAANRRSASPRSPPSFPLLSNNNNATTTTQQLQLERQHQTRHVRLLLRCLDKYTRREFFVPWRKAQDSGEICRGVSIWFWATGILFQFCPPFFFLFWIPGKIKQF